MNHIEILLADINKRVDWLNEQGIEQPLLGQIADTFMEIMASGVAAGNVEACKRIKELEGE